jgi:UDP-N-acetylglucosamine 1-carboxyvinyltransferase
MAFFFVEGGRPLSGSIRPTGNKNAALPILAATLLADGPMTVGNVPHLHDVTTTIELLGRMGVDVTIDDRMRVAVDPTMIKSFYAPYELVKTMRASILVLGPLLARYGKATVSLPGGCAIGTRPVNLHVDGLRAMGAEIEVENGYINARCGRLRGARIVLDTVTVTGTENLMMAACLAKGETVIENAAREPEVVDLARCLNEMGAKISGAGSHTLRIEGVDTLSGTEYSVLPDRIETGTFVLGAAITRGRIAIEGARFEHLTALFDKLEESGLHVVRNGSDHLLVDATALHLSPVDIITLPHPGFPTDLQAQMCALMTVTPGLSIVTEKIYPHRFMHVPELQRMGADIAIEGASAIIKGTRSLSGAPVMASDRRASAALFLAGLAASGETWVQRVYHIDRGYERIEEKLSALGARIRRTPN